MNAIGVIGVGFVGTAIREGFAHAVRVETYDRNPSKRTCDSVEDLVKKTDGPIFVAVPTPMRPDGSCDTSIIESVCRDIDRVSGSTGRILILKSTIVPGTTAKLALAFPNLRFVFNPEFLTEANPINDFKNQKFVVLGASDREAFREVELLYARAFPDAAVFWKGWGEAEAFKYVANTFLALKVAFSNEVYNLCQALGLDHGEIISIAQLDPRLGATHWVVPGPDGKRGFSGSCFPKDLNALISLARERGVSLRTLEAAWATNLEVRPEKDWESLKGRAVVA